MPYKQRISSQSAHWRWVAGCALAGCLSAAALAQTASPESLKAEVIYRVLMFVTWPPERDAPEGGLQVCTVGESRTEGRMEGSLQALSGRPIRQLTVAVRRIARADQLAGCHLLYLPAPQPALRPMLAQASVLVVSDTAAMLDQGAMINLQVEDGRIVFDVELDAARRAGLVISTKLLRLARFVRHQTATP
ncbi:YfiR family protein [Roseateles sp.]|uniref:YfiR family protein n=1 Tax=Roseateles sp. TaxID=1971397 RepID=UPI003266C862